MTNLDAATLAAMRAAAPALPNGTFSIAHPEKGHFTVKLWTALNGQLAGKRILSLLTGPDNTGDFTGVAFWDDEQRRAVVWKKHRDPSSRTPIDGYRWQQHGWSRIEQKVAIFVDLALRGAEPERHGHWFTEGYTLLAEKRCVRCNRVLTHPESIELGLGPECAKR